MRKEKSLLLLIVLFLALLPRIMQFFADDPLIIPDRLQKTNKLDEALITIIHKEKKPDPVQDIATENSVLPLNPTNERK